MRDVDAFSDSLCAESILARSRVRYRDVNGDCPVITLFELEGRNSIFSHFISKRYPDFHSEVWYFPAQSSFAFPIRLTPVQPKRAKSGMREDKNECLDAEPLAASGC